MTGPIRPPLTALPALTDLSPPPTAGLVLVRRPALRHRVQLAQLARLRDRAAHGPRAAGAAARARHIEAQLRTMVAAPPTPPRAYAGERRPRGRGRCRGPGRIAVDGPRLAAGVAADRPPRRTAALHPAAACANAAAHPRRRARHGDVGELSVSGRIGLNAVPVDEIHDRPA
jgi:hypothetical protein